MSKRRLFAIGLFPLLALLAFYTTVSGCRIAPDHARMWEQTFTDEQWLGILRQRKHQPVAVWHGIRNGSISADGYCLSIGGLTFQDSESLAFEHQLSSGLFEKKPLLFLSLFEDDDPETVLKA